VAEYIDSNKPRRIQLSRKKGWRMPPNTVSVARPTKWGNPFRVGDATIPDAREAVHRFRRWIADKMVVGPPPPDPSELRGKNLACWCPLNQPCHATVLLELANAPHD
jgi:hypothetical protein